MVPELAADTAVCTETSVRMGRVPGSCWVLIALRSPFCFSNAVPAEQKLTHQLPRNAASHSPAGALGTLHSSAHRLLQSLGCRAARPCTQEQQSCRAWSSLACAPSTAAGTSALQHEMSPHLTGLNSDTIASSISAAVMRPSSTNTCKAAQQGVVALQNPAGQQCRLAMHGLALLSSRGTAGCSSLRPGQSICNGHACQLLSSTALSTCGHNQLQPAHPPSFPCVQCSTPAHARPTCFFQHKPPAPVRRQEGTMSRQAKAGDGGVTQPSSDAAGVEPTISQLHQSLTQATPVSTAKPTPLSASAAAWKMPRVPPSTTTS